MQSADAVLVHGAGGGAWEWAVWRRVFAARAWRCATPELQPVAAGLAATRFDDYVAQVVAATRAQASDHAGTRDSGPVLIGASLGGLLVLAAAAQLSPCALVLVNPMSPAGAAEPRHARSAVDGIVRWGSRRSLASTLRALPDADDAARMFAFRRWRDESAAVLGDACAGIAIASPACPVLVIASERDDDVPAATSRALAAALGADLHMVAGASHVGPMLGRSAAQVARDALAWIARRCGGAGAM